MSATAPAVVTEHQQAWWGTQKCRRCNMAGIPARNPDLTALVLCPDCDGSGWTVWAALATEPWSEIIPNLFVGGHDYNVGYQGVQELRVAYPKDHFDVVVSMYRRSFDFDPPQGVEFHEVLFPDSEVTPELVRQAMDLSLRVSLNVERGRRVLSRCQAGLNRSSLVAGLAMIRLGFSGADAVQLIRARRSPWALCNEDYADFLMSGEAERSLTGSACTVRE